MTDERRQPEMIAFVVTGSTNGKNRWRDIGAAWRNKDASLTVKLTALPVNGELVLRPREEA